ncbi:MAG: 4-alpha-glucanotransferase [Chloroflexota bacterium]|nr:4-alpha-glucanotransferase [Chloroflexota bacterium]
MRYPRSAGILLHPTSLPSRFGIGDLGPAAYRFVDFLVKSGQSLWQILPLGPTGYGDSPYQCFSAFAGNPLLIDLAALQAVGDISAELLAAVPEFPEKYVDYGPVINFKYSVLQEAARNFHATQPVKYWADFEQFCAANQSWLADFALFMAFKGSHGGAPWHTWEWELTSRQPAALAAARERLAPEIFAHKYYQYRFFRQWETLKKYAHKQGIQIIGDIPIFVAFDSADLWANPHRFHLDEKRQPTAVAGVPPDYFSPTGQLWGNPLYRWDVLAEEGYSWWIDRFTQTFKLVDIVRLDHFRGFEAYWEVPAGEDTAINGHWEQGPGQAFFRTVKDVLGELPILAEDLGFITDGVRELRDAFDLPGMKILQFAFTSDASNRYLPHNCLPNSVIYTGTHDNETTMGWYQSRGKKEKEKLHTYLGPVSEAINWALIRLAYSSVANTAIIPLQDVLGLDNTARMNTPATPSGNWGWRFRDGDLLSQYRHKLRELALTYGRTEPAQREAMPDYM